ncbi:MAG TPA: rhomboid family intramembrane serine protease [Saprospiraceae bacterium]|nr:rhomboid family intramembrane serine protease [Saprospiraceae bacterium]
MFKELFQTITEQLRTRQFWTLWIIVCSIVCLIIMVFNSYLYYSHRPEQSSFLYHNMVLMGNWTETLKKPWTIFTHVFYYNSLWSLIFQMIFLYWISYLVQDFVGKNHAVSIFIYSIFLPAIVFISVNQLLSNSLIGLSSTYFGIMGLMVSAATIAPNFPLRLILIGNVALKYVALVLLTVGFFQYLYTGIAHLSAYIMAVVIAYAYMALQWKGISLNLFRKNKISKKRNPTVDYSKSKKENVVMFSKEAELNRILDQIRKQGVDSLSEKDKEFLKKYGADS